MGDAFTHASLGEIKTDQGDESAVEKSKRLLLYALYEWYTYTGKGSTKRGALEKTLVRRTIGLDDQKLIRHGPQVEKLEHRILGIGSRLKKGDETMWLRLLMWMGRSHHMFGQFKSLSPFADKELISVDVSESSDHTIGHQHQKSLPNISCLYGPDEGDSEVHGRLVLISPKGVKVAVHIVKEHS